MCRGHLERAQVFLAPEPPDEMNASGIDAVGDFVMENRLPRGAVWRQTAIGGAVIANHQDFRFGPLAQNSRQGAHKDMIAAQRLEIARDESDDLVLSRQPPTGG